MNDHNLDNLLEQAAKAETELNRLQNNFLSAAGHEFRTPLTIIDAAARRLDKQASGTGADPAEIRLKAATIRSTVTRLVELVERTFELARLTTNQFSIVPETVSLRSIIEHACTAQASRSPKCEILTDLTQCPDHAVGDGRFIDMIVDKLLRGSVELIGQDGRVEIASWREGDNMVLSIKSVCEVLSSTALDSMENQLDVFMASDRLLDEGMEFKLARFLVEMHRGEVDFHTDQARNLEIEVTLPINFETNDMDVTSPKMHVA